MDDVLEELKSPPLIIFSGQFQVVRTMLSRFISLAFAVDRH